MPGRLAGEVAWRPVKEPRDRVLLAWILKLSEITVKVDSGIGTSIMRVVQEPEDLQT